MERYSAPVAGFTVDVATHPNADKLFVATVDVGNNQNKPIVFGGDYRLKPGEMAAVALPGTRLPSGEKIRPRNWRGIKSYGELLSSDELGWTVNGPDEVAILEPTECRLGQSLGPIAIQHALAMYLPDRGSPTVLYMKFFCKVYDGIQKET